MKFLNSLSRRTKNAASFNMTPIIDIVFLLIIFFLVVCRFIEAENFPVNVPDNCLYAQAEEEPNPAVATLTILKKSEKTVTFAVGSELINAHNPEDLVVKLANALNKRLESLPPDDRTVILRIDKDIPFRFAKYALWAVSVSTATDIQLAALKHNHPQ